MSRKSNKNKKDGKTVSATWVYDEELGWVNVNLFLANLKKIEESVRKRAGETG